MEIRELIDLQLDAIFDNTLPPKIQSLVDNELSQGRWFDGYDIAVKPTGLNSSEAEDLLEVVISNHSKWRIDRDQLLASVEKCLPQSMAVKVLWMVADDGSFILTDSLRVARNQNEKPVWVSPRISFDGISLVSVSDRFVKGNAFLGSDSPFLLDFSSGEIHQGTIIEI